MENYYQILEKDVLSYMQIYQKDFTEYDKEKFSNMNEDSQFIFMLRISGTQLLSIDKYLEDFEKNPYEIESFWKDVKMYAQCNKRFWIKLKGQKMKKISIEELEKTIKKMERELEREHRNKMW